MPTLYQGICRHCGHKTPVMASGYGAVLVDRPVEGEQHEVAGAVIRTGEGDTMAMARDPRLVVLRHPVESSDLAKTGYTWNEVFRQGRYVEVTNVACRKCGTVFQRKRLAAKATAGCVSSLVAGLVSGVAMGVVSRSIVIGLVAGCAGMMVVLIVAESAAKLRIRYRFAERAAALAAERACPKCQADDAQPVARKRRAMCPKCSTASLRFIPVGVS